MPTAGAGIPAGWGLSVFLKSLPFETRADVLAVMPGWMRDDTVPNPVRDAIADGVLRSFASYCSDVAAYAASVDPAYASGSALDFALAQRDVQRALNEADAPYRARGLGDSALITPAAMLAAIQAIIAPFAPGKQPYYFELPDDEIYVFDQASGTQTGFYLGVDFPIVDPFRNYSARPNSQPRHGILWSGARSKTGLPGYLYLPGGPPFGTPSPPLSDAVDAIGMWGNVVVAIPAFPMPGAQLDGDAFLINDPSAGGTVPLIDISGNLTPAAVAAGAAMGEVFTAASSSSTLGSNLFSAGSDVATVVSQVQALLATRGPFGAQYTLMLDPNL